VVLFYCKNSKFMTGREGLMSPQTETKASVGFKAGSLALTLFPVEVADSSSQLRRVILSFFYLRAISLKGGLFKGTTIISSRFYLKNQREEIYRGCL
jgi:hypothetical protein